jgi:predicted CXXCH cytochrome family protein
VLPSPPDMARLLLAAVLTLAAALGCAHRAPSAAPAPPPAPARKVEFTPVPALVIAHAANPHDFEGKPLCQRCHVPGEEGPQVDPISLCTQCHDAAPMKHPFRVTQPGGARGLPLMPGDVVACHTCHDPHDVKARRSGLRLAYSELCLRCHVRHGDGPAR